MNTNKQSYQVSELHFVAQESWRWLDWGRALGRMGVFQLASCCSASRSCFLLWVLKWGKCTDLWLLSCHYAGSHSNQSPLCWPALRPRPAESAPRSHVSMRLHICALVLLRPGWLTIGVCDVHSVCEAAPCIRSHSCFTSVCIFLYCYRAQSFELYF